MRRRVGWVDVAVALISKKKKKYFSFFAPHTQFDSMKKG